MNKPEWEEWAARLLLMEVPHAILWRGIRRWYVEYKGHKYRALSIYKNGQIAVHNEAMLKKALVDPSRFTTLN